MSSVMWKRRYVAAVFVVVLGALGAAHLVLENEVTAQGTRPQAPAFEVDPFWPKPLPNNWVLGSTIGVAVDAQDHVWIVHRQDAVEENFKAAALKPPVGTCCIPAPPVLEFDSAGNLVGHWGGPGAGYEWPQSNHGIVVDHKGNVWVGSNGAKDTHVLKFTRAGKFLMQIGKQGKSGGSNDTENLNKPAKMYVDPETNELYVADGYGNRRVIVYDADTGKYKRHWGAYGNKPDDTPFTYNPDAPAPKQFGNPVHCAELAKDGLLYVCDRSVDRIQVFRKDGTFVKEAFYAKQTLRSGSVWDLTFSRDPGQQYLYIADGVNEKVYVVLRDTLELLTSFGSGGRQPGQFYGVHSVATDSQGNLYTTETYSGARVQKFAFKGMRAVQKPDQGVLWPSSTSK
jgi:DNA-binding beta-propeller fold protein YncE